MKTTQSIISALLAIILGVATAGTAAAACNNGTFSGTYLYRADGFTYKGNASVNLMAATSGFSAVGILRLNGLGGGSGAESVSNAGVLSDRTFTPSYQVNSDCTATINLNYCPLDRCDGPIPSLPNLVVASDGRARDCHPLVLAVGFSSRSTTYDHRERRGDRGYHRGISRARAPLVSFSPDTLTLAQTCFGSVIEQRLPDPSLSSAVCCPLLQAYIGRRGPKSLRYRS